MYVPNTMLFFYLQLTISFKHGIRIRWIYIQDTGSLTAYIQPTTEYMVLEKDDDKGVNNKR